jgi:hypothetical protein
MKQSVLPSPVVTIRTTTSNMKNSAFFSQNTLTSSVDPFFTKINNYYICKVNQLVHLKDTNTECHTPTNALTIYRVRQ